MSPSPGVSVQMSSPGGRLPSVPGIQFFLVADDLQSADCVGRRSGTGTQLALSGSNVTLTDAAANFLATEVGMYIAITGAATAANNGAWRVTARTATTVTWVNAFGATEAGSFPWTLGGRLSSLLCRKTGQNFVQATDANRPLVIASSHPPPSEVNGGPGGTTNLLNRNYLSSASAQRYLSLNDAGIAGLFNGSGDFSIGFSGCPVAFGTPAHVAISDAAATFNNSIRHCTPVTIGTRLIRTVAAVSTNADGTGGLAASQWSPTWISTYQASGTTWRHYIGGTENENVVTSSVSLASLAHLIAGATGSLSAHWGGFFAANVRWTAANVTTVNSFFNAIYGMP